MSETPLNMGLLGLWMPSATIFIVTNYFLWHLHEKALRTLLFELTVKEMNKRDDVVPSTDPLGFKFLICKMIMPPSRSPSWFWDVIGLRMKYSSPKLQHLETDWSCLSESTEGRVSSGCPFTGPMTCSWTCPVNARVPGIVDRKRCFEQV